MAYESDFETLGGYFGVTLGSCVGLMGPKSGNVEKVLVFKAFLEGQGSHEDAKESLQLSGPDRWERVGGGKPSSP